jgi:hypothetical protein
MLQPLRVSAPLAAPSIATASASLATVTAVNPSTEATASSTSAPLSALAKVCAVEGLAVHGKTKQNHGPSLYGIELFFCVPGRPSAMLALGWRIGADMGDREPDARVAKPYQRVFQLYNELNAIATKCPRGKKSRCRLCHLLKKFTEDYEHAPSVLDRAFIGTTRKCLRVQEVLNKFIYFVVLAQRPARPGDPYVPNCENQAEIAVRVATLLEL